MIEAHHNDDESKRLKDLESYKILDTSNEASFNQLASLASVVCQTPVALISFIDRNRQWFKASIGIDLNEVPRYLSACNETIMKTDYFVFNADSTDSVYADFLLKLGFSFYAGVPIVSELGNNIGTVCVLDYVPRDITDEQLASLEIISKQISTLLELRLIYQNNLDRLKELGEKSNYENKKIQSIVYKEKLRSYAELSAGLAFRLKTQVVVINNVKNEMSKSCSQCTNELSVLENSISNIFRTIESLDAFVHAEKEQSMKPFEVNEVIKNVLLNLEYKIKELKIEVSFESEDSIMMVGNMFQFSEVINAVIVNAIEAVAFMSERKIQIKFLKNNHQAHIDVIDSGAGVNESTKPYIFQPFFTTKSANSLGIGLSLGETLMHRHRGEIQLIKISSPTIFRISFPAP